MVGAFQDWMQPAWDARALASLAQQIRRLANKRTCSWLKDDIVVMARKLDTISEELQFMVWLDGDVLGLDVGVDMRMLYEDLAMKV